MFPDATAIRLQNIALSSSPSSPKSERWFRDRPEKKTLYLYRTADTSEENFMDFYHRLEHAIRGLEKQGIGGGEADEH